MEFVTGVVLDFISCVFTLFGYLLLLAFVGWVLGLFIPIANFIPTAIAYFYISCLLMVVSLPLFGCFVLNKTKIDDALLAVTEEEMPVLRPVPTATVHQEGWFNKLLAYMFVPRTWRLMQNWHWIYKTPEGKKVELVVPKGFECDAASIPRPFRALFNPTGALLLPALLHDFAYKYNQLWQVDKNDFIEYKPFKDLPLEKQREGWDNFLFEAGMQLNGLLPVNWTIRHLGRIGLTKKTWKIYRDKNATVIVPVKPTPQEEVPLQIQALSSAPDIECFPSFR